MGTVRLARELLVDTKQTPSPPVRRRHHRGPARKTLLFKPRLVVLGRYLRACRCRPGRHGRGLWSLRSVARLAQMSHTTLSLVETGKRRAVADDLLNLADVLGVDREQLLVQAGYLPAPAQALRTRHRLTSAERELLQQVRTHPQLLPILCQLLRQWPSAG